MTTNTTRRLYSLLSEVSGRPEQDIRPELALFGKGLMLDSLSGVNLLAGLSRDFDLTLEDIDLAMDALDSVGSLTALLSSRTYAEPSDAGMELLEEVARAAHLQEGRAGVERVLSKVGGTEGLTSRELAASCALPTPTVSAVRKELVRAGLLHEAGRGACLTAVGTALVARLVSGSNREERDFRAYIQPKYLNLVDDLAGALAPVLQLRPAADTALDQAKCLPETSAARAVLALEYGAVCGRRVAFIGDDDFTSLGLAFLGRLLAERGKLGPERLTVLDIDQRIVDQLNELALEHRLPLQALVHDVRHALPEAVVGNHDAFFTDPPYTVAGAELFVSRGLSTTRGRGSLAFFSFASKGPADMLQVHRSLAAMGLLTREILPGFNTYEGGSLWGNRSQMIVLEVVPQAATPDTATHEGPLYTADFRRKRGK